MEALPEFVYPDDMVIARAWLESGRVNHRELEVCFRLQRADPPPPRTLEQIGSDVGIFHRMAVSDAVGRFEEESKHRLTRDRRLAEGAGPDAQPPDYLLVRRMGEGGQGEVFLAQQREPKRVVVLKRLLGDLATDGRNVARFLQEALLMERVDDPQVVHVFDYGVDSGVFYIALEYVAGENLGEYLQRRRFLPLRETLELVRAAAGALAALADAGVVHADVKPHNFVLPVKGPRVKLIDFGAAVLAGAPQSVGGGWFGSPAFMAPEQFRGERLGAETDLYALGIMTYHLLTGKLPFESGSLSEMARMHAKEPLPSLLALVPGIPSRAARLVRRMTEKKREERMGSFEELVDEIERILEAPEEDGEDGAGLPEAVSEVIRPLPDRPGQTRSVPDARMEETSGSPPSPRAPADRDGSG